MGILIAGAVEGVGSVCSGAAVSCCSEDGGIDREEEPYIL